MKINIIHLRRKVAPEPRLRIWVSGRILDWAIIQGSGHD